MKFVKKFFLVFVMMFALMAFIACGSDDIDTNKIEDLLKESVVVNFDTQGGSAIEKQTVKVSEAASFKLPADPTKEGYAFVGWYLDSNFTNEFKNLEAKAGEITLYAKWQTVSATSIVVKFETNGGTPVNNVVVDVTKFDLSAFSGVVTIKEGEVFAGWYLDAGLTKVVNAQALTTLLTQKEVTLYAKWVKEGDLPAVDGIQFNLTVSGQVDADVTATSTKYEDVYDGDGSWTGSNPVSTTTKHTLNGTANVGVDCALELGTGKFNEVGLALVVSFDLNETNDGKQEIALPKTEIKVYLNNGILYAFIPGELVGAEDDLGVSVDLMSVYNTNIETVKGYLKELVALLKSLPAEEFPEGFDLSVLDRIDIDNLKLEDLLGLLALLPEEYQDVLENPEELSVDGILDLIFGTILPMTGVELPEAVVAEIKKLVSEIAEILKGLIPTVDMTDTSIKVELTDKQVKDTIDALATYLKTNIKDIITLVYSLSGSGHEKKPYDLEYYEYDYDGNKRYIFQPKYVDPEGVTHTYREEVAANPGATYIDCGIIDGNLFFPNYYPQEAYYVSVAFDMSNNWEMLIVDTQAYYTVGENYYNIYLFEGKTQAYDTQSKSYISFAAAYELLKTQEYSPFYFFEDYNMYIFGNLYLDTNFNILSEEQVAEIRANSVAQEAVPMIDAYVALIKKALNIRDAHLTATINGTSVTAEGKLDVKVDIEKGEGGILNGGPEDEAHFAILVTANANVGLATEAITYPDFSAYTDMTAMVNALVDNLLHEVFGGSEE